MSEMYFKVTPRDTLLFRDGLPMSKATSNYIESLTLPHPSVFYGMLTTALMEEGYLKKVAELVRDISQKKNKGGSLDDEQKSALSIHGTYLMKNN